MILIFHSVENQLYLNMINDAHYRSERNREIVLRYLDGENASELGKRFSLTRMGIWHVLKNDPEWDSDRWSRRHKAARIAMKEDGLL